MANDERPQEHDEERRFLEGLKARTGRDLAEWMAAIAAQGFSDKNEIIDWLRNEGLPFARASWLERIHRNGGKPIHSAAPPAGAGAPAAAASASRPAPVPQHTSPPQQRATASSKQQPTVPAVAKASPEPVASPELSASRSATQGVASAQPGSRPSRKGPKPPPLVEAPADTAALEKLLAAAKGYRPLYHHLEAQIRRAVPGAIVAPRERYVAIGAPLEFAAVTLHPTEVRLGLALGERPFDAPLQPSKLRGPGPAITHMLVLTDARQLDEGLLALIQAAHARVNAAPR